MRIPLKQTFLDKILFGTEKPENDIDHTKTKARSPQTNGICERFHRTILNEFYQIAFRKKIYRTLESLRLDLDECIHNYNHDRTHQGKMYCKRTPMETFMAGKSKPVD